METREIAAAPPAATPAALLLRGALRFRPEELIPAVFFIPSALVTLLAYRTLIDLDHAVPPRIIHGFIRLAVTGACMAAFLIAVRRRPSWGRVSWLRDVIPFLFCIAVYTNLHDTIHFVNPHDVHDALIRIDDWMFGVQPCVWAQQFYSPLLTDLFSISYMNYFLIAVSVTAWLLVQRRHAEMREALFGTICCFYFGYVLYLIFPAAPPRLTLADQFTRDFTGGLLTQAQNALIVLNPTSARGAFPSLHCCIALVSVLYAWKFSKPLFAILVVPATLLVLATVYLRHHYVIDIWAGFALAVFSFKVAPSLDRAWRELQERHGVA